MSDLLVRMKHWLQYPRLSSGEKLMGEAVAELERLQKIITDHLDHTADGVLVCEWTYDEDGPWETGCGRAWEFMEDGVAENGVKYCPFCGGLVTEPKAAGGDDE